MLAECSKHRLAVYVPDWASAKKLFLPQFYLSCLSEGLWTKLHTNFLKPKNATGMKLSFIFSIF